MGKFEQEAKDLLAAIGGKENVTAVVVSFIVTFVLYKED